jgi:alkaline phosphatase
LGALEGKKEPILLPMMKFPVAGSATTHDLTSFVTDSASAGTALATGNKTNSGVLNMDGEKAKPFETIAEKLHKQKGWKIGIVTSVNVNHATPAAFFGHQPSRDNYYELSNELIGSGFEFFAGGKLRDSRKGEFDRMDVYSALKAKGYTVIMTAAEYRGLKGGKKKLAIFSDDKDFSDDTGTMHYEIDRPKMQPNLADYVKTGIVALENNTGFFMMVEGGKIDWACHANDAATVVHDVLAFSDAVQAAVDFYNKHPKDTLIVVTGDHETGGMSFGFAGTGYDTRLDLLANQKVSFVEYDKQVAKFRTDKATFSDALASIEANFGISAKPERGGTGSSLPKLSDFELAQIRAAFEKSILPPKQRTLTEAEKLLYGTYEPLTVTVTRILNHKAGIGWTTYSHTGLPVPVFAMGPGQSRFAGYNGNIDVYRALKDLTDAK